MPQILAFSNAVGMDADGARNARQRQLFEFVQKRKQIYLDTNWWSRMRKARFETNAPPADKEVLRLLHRLVASERAICMSSGACMEELLRQDDRYSRLATASTMDSLSCGLSYCSKEQQAIFELSEWLAAQFEDSTAVSPARECVVTCPAYNILYPRIIVRSSSPQLDRLFPVLVDHTCFAMTHCEALAVWDEWTEDPDLPDRVSNNMNADPRITKEPNSRFTQVFTDEAIGYLNAYWPHLCSAARRGQDAKSLFQGHALTEAVGRLRSLLSGPEPREGLPPAMSIIAAGYATMRTSQKRKFKPGDWHDLNHAAMALPHAEVFITEHSLRHLVTTAPFTKCVRHRVNVVSRQQDVISLLTTLDN